MKRQILAGVTALSMLCSAVPMAVVPETASIVARAEYDGGFLVRSGFCGNGEDGNTASYFLQLNNGTGTLTIKGAGQMGNFGLMDNYVAGASYSSPYPKSVWSEFNEWIKTIVIEDGITSIGMGAFNCSAVEHVTIPDSVTWIRDTSFFGCSDLKEITIPESVIRIDWAAFASCKNLNTVELPSSVKKIGRGAFYGCSSLTSIDIPDSVEIIDENVFQYCKGLTSIEIPDSVTTIKKGAFYGCEGLTEITFPANVETVEDRVLLECTNLQKVTVLNPDCNITCFDGSNYGGANYKPYHGTIYGYEGSTAQAYAEKYDIPFVSLDSAPENPDSVSLGDVNADGSINASDAAVVLIAAAAMGAGGDSGLTDAQMKAAEVNGDAAVNASDAAVILIYAAAVGAGSTETLEEYLAAQEEEKELHEFADSVVKIVNTERQKAGLKALYAVPVLYEAANIRAKELTSEPSHTRPDGRDCLTVLNDQNIPWEDGGENIAYGYFSPEEFMDVWMNSSGHKANILQKDFDYIGVGVAKIGGSIYCVQLFTGGKTLSGGYLPE